LHRFDAVRDLYDFASGGIVVGVGDYQINEFHAAARSSISALRMTVLSASSGKRPLPPMSPGQKTHSGFGSVQASVQS
jgi:hypothetical protein